MDENSYPITLPDSDGDDRRFTFGFVHEVGEVFARHGYPPVGQSWRDHLELQQALYRFIYVGGTRTERLAS
ncbi:hypothetical protein LFM09_47800 [Lentzea alba]|uniref:hypothetical protein n=1 Tax=Lentzea alba TaxID=2714351 RepID=UPI0039BFE9EE